MEATESNQNIVEGEDINLGTNTKQKAYCTWPSCAIGAYCT